MTLLAVESLGKSFGGLTAVDGVSFAVPPRTITAVIGPNGAGKSTLFNLISGLERPSRGRIMFDGHDLGGLAPHRRATLGLARTFQTPQIFAGMTVLDNVMVGSHRHGRAGMLEALVRTRRSRREDDRLHARSLAQLERVGLADKADAPAGDLAFGQLKLLEMARALAVDPKLLLLDEFAAGLTRGEAEHMANIIRAVRAAGVTVLLVEHDMALVMRLSDSVVVLNFGEKIAEGPPATVQAMQQVIDVYLGSGI